MTINYNGTIKSLRDIVWGVVTNPLSQIEQITLLIFIKLLSERHNELERMESKKLIFTGEFASYHFDSLTRLTGYELVDTVRKAIESLYKNPNIEEPIRRLYERSYLQVNDPRVLSLLINEINKIDIKSIDMGDFYEHLLAVLGTQKEAGQFRTPRHLIKFIVDIVDPQIGERVLDPACGTAGFLTASFIHIRNTNTSKEAKEAGAYLDKLNLDQKTFLLNKTIYGYDIDPNMIKFAISNLYLHNIKNPNISQHNTLTSNDGWEERYDVILTNPPFSTPKGGVKPTDRFTLNSKRTEVLFVEYVIEHLTLNGRAGVIVPEGIIFQSGKAYKELRKWLVENNYLYAIVSLPSGVFNPYSGVKTSIFFIDREKARQSDKILFCKVENDGFDLGAQRRPIDKNDLPEVLKVIKNFQTDPKKDIEEKLGWTVEKKKIVDSKDYSLFGDRYKDIVNIANQKWPMVELGETCEVFNGITSGKSDYTDQGTVKIIKVKDYDEQGIYFDKDESGWIKQEIKTDKYLQIGDTLIINAAHSASHVGSKIGYCKFLPFFKCLPSGEVMIVRPHKEIKALLLNNIIKSVFFRQKIRELVKGIHLYPKDVNTIKIPLPPLSVQQQIVDELDGYQKIIDGAKQVVDNYKPQIKIDPKWEKVRLGEVIDLLTDYTANGSFASLKENVQYKNQKDYALLVRLTDLRKNLKNENKIFVSEHSYKFLKKSSLCGGEYLIANVGANIGDVYLMPKIDQLATLGPNMYLVKYNNKVVTSFLYVISESIIKPQVLKSSISAAQPKINKDQFRNIEIPLPPLKMQLQIVSKIEEEQKLVEANKKLIQLFEEKIKDRIKEVWGE